MASNMNDYSPKVKKWIAYAITGAICSDGVVSQEELEFLKKAIDFLDDKESVYAIVEMAKEKTIPDLTYLSNEDVSRQQALRIMHLIGSIIIDDYKLTKTEKTYLEIVAHKLRFSNEFYKGFIDYLERAISLNIFKESLSKLAMNTGHGLNIE